MTLLVFRTEEDKSSHQETRKVNIITIAHGNDDHNLNLKDYNTQVYDGLL